MSGAALRRFLRDERGGYTIWSLVWFMLYVAIGGLAVDVTDAYRNEIMLQSTADSAALAAVQSLPSESAAKTEALAYSSNNMDAGVNGTVLKDPEVVVGKWDFDAKKFTPTTTNPNAVWVVTRRAVENQNPIGMNFLRILALFGLTPEWNVSTEAIAARFVPDCLTKNALLANNKVDVTSNNHFNAICVHGQNNVVDNGQDYAINIQNGNIIESGSQFTMPSLTMMDGRPNVYTMNQGLADAVSEGDMWAQDARDVQRIIAGLYPTQTTVPNTIPSYMYFSQGGVDYPQVKHISANYSGSFDPGWIYIADSCNSQQSLQLPTGVEIQKVVILATCQIHAASGVIIHDAVLASSAVGNGANPLLAVTIDLASDAQLGTSDFCSSATGKVYVYAAASVHIAAGPTVYGLRIVAGGDINFTAGNDVYGISAEAGHNITATAGGDWTWCPGGTFDGPYAFSYRLVH